VLQNFNWFRRAEEFRKYDRGMSQDCSACFTTTSNGPILNERAGRMDLGGLLKSAWGNLPCLFMPERTHRQGFGMLMREPVSIAVEGLALDEVAGNWDWPEGEFGNAACLLAHGAGASMESEFMARVAEALAKAGVPVLRFRYAYAERAARAGRRRPPDRRAALESVHLAALKALRERLPDKQVLLAGKSMGGRMASLLAAEGTPCAGLVFLGYPLHPAGQPQKLRSEHFAACLQPALFLQGDRDRLCDLKLLRPALELYGGSARLEVIEGADHGFEILKRSGLDRDEVRADLVRRILAWMAVSLAPGAVR